MIQVIITIFCTILFYFTFKLLYNIIIIVALGQIIAKAKAKGKDFINDQMDKGGGSNE